MTIEEDRQRLIDRRTREGNEEDAFVESCLTALPPEKRDDKAAKNARDIWPTVKAMKEAKKARMQ